jgi:hypothetical protein
MGKTTQRKHSAYNLGYQHGKQTAKWDDHGEYEKGYHYTKHPFLNSYKAGFKAGYNKERFGE